MKTITFCPLGTLSNKFNRYYIFFLFTVSSVSPTINLLICMGLWDWYRTKGYGIRRISLSLNPGSKAALCGRLHGSFVIPLHSQSPQHYICMLQHRINVVFSVTKYDRIIILTT